MYDCIEIPDREIHRNMIALVDSRQRNTQLYDCIVLHPWSEAVEWSLTSNTLIVRTDLEAILL